MSTVKIAFIVLSRYLHITAGFFSFDSLYLAGKTPLLIGDMLINFWDMLPETSKSSACWGMGGDSHLTCPSSDSLYLPLLIKLELESKTDIDPSVSVDLLHRQ